MNTCKTLCRHGLTIALWPRKYSLIFNDVNVFVKQRKKMNKDVLRFFYRNGMTHLSFLTPFVFRIVNRGVVTWTNFDLVLVRQSKQMLFFTWEKYNPNHLFISNFYPCRAVESYKGLSWYTLLTMCERLHLSLSNFRHTLK